MSPLNSFTWLPFPGNPDSRGHGLRDGHAGGAPLPGRAHHRDLRGYQRDPETGCGQPGPQRLPALVGSSPEPPPSTEAPYSCRAMTLNPLRAHNRLVPSEACFALHLWSNSIPILWLKSDLFTIVWTGQVTWNPHVFKFGFRSYEVWTECNLNCQ